MTKTFRGVEGGHADGYHIFNRNELQQKKRESLHQQTNSSPRVPTTYTYRRWFGWINWQCPKTKYTENRTAGKFNQRRRKTSKNILFNGTMVLADLLLYHSIFTFI